jgi:hypothetical protein
MRWPKHHKIIWLCLALPAPVSGTFRYSYDGPSLFFGTIGNIEITFPDIFGLCSGNDKATYHDYCAYPTDPSDTEDNNEFVTATPTDLPTSSPSDPTAEPTAYPMDPSDPADTKDNDFMRIPTKPPTSSLSENPTVEPTFSPIANLTPYTTDQPTFAPSQYSTSAAPVFPTLAPTFDEVPAELWLEDSGCRTQTNVVERLSLISLASIFFSTKNTLESGPLYDQGWLSNCDPCTWGRVSRQDSLIQELDLCKLKSNLCIPPFQQC